MSSWHQSNLLQHHRFAVRHQANGERIGNGARSGVYSTRKAQRVQRGAIWRPERTVGIPATYIESTVLNCGQHRVELHPQHLGICEALGRDVLPLGYGFAQI